MAAELRSTRLLLAAAVAALLLSAPTAAAQEPTPTPTPTPTATPPPVVPTPTPTPAPDPKPVAATMQVKAPTGMRDRGRKLALQGRRVRVKGTVIPFVAGQKAVLRVRQAGKTLKRRKVAVRQGPGGKGVFSTRLRLRRTGSVLIAGHSPRTAGTKRARARNVSLLVARPALSAGSRGPLVRLFQRRLRKLRYATGTSGLYDARTGRAVMAWRKVNGRARTESADAGVVRGVLAKRGGWVVRHPKAGRHIEADLSQQVLSLVDGKRVVRTYTTSSGAPATPTIIGRFRFYRKDPGTNSLGMVHSSYFIRGYAIHGYHSVPPYNASHGCLRVPIPDARRIFDWISLGDLIYVSS